MDTIPDEQLLLFGQSDIDDRDIQLLPEATNSAVENHVAIGTDDSVQTHAVIETSEPSDPNYSMDVDQTPIIQ